MSDLLKVRVVAREGARVVLRVRLLPTETGQFCVAREFAWMLLDPAANDGVFDEVDGAALAACADAKNDIDEANMAAPNRVRLAHALVRSVAVTDVRNYTEVRPRDLWDAAPNAKAEEELYPEALYAIDLADARLGAHLAVGFEWASNAYDEMGTNEFLPYA